MDLLLEVASDRIAGGRAGPSRRAMRGRAGGGAYDQFGLQRDLCGGTAVVVMLQKHVDGRPTRGRRRSGDRGQSGAGEPRERVVYPDDAQLARNIDTEAFQAVE